MKYKITFLILVFMTTFSFAQNHKSIEGVSQKVEMTADDITDTYDAQLAMRAKQKALFKLKVEEYLMKRREIENAYDGKEELTALAKMQLQETGDMADILTQIQMDVYKKIKPKIQPLKMVDEEEVDKK